MPSSKRGKATQYKVADGVLTIYKDHKVKSKLGHRQKRETTCALIGGGEEGEEEISL